MPTTTWPRQPQRSLQATPTAATHHSQQRPAKDLRLQKQHSFTEANRTQQHTGGGSGGSGGSGHLLASRRAGSVCLTRGLSMDRSLESIRQKLTTQKSTTAACDAQTKRLNKSSKNVAEKLKVIKNTRTAEGKISSVRTGSTSSLLKSLDHELKQVNGQLHQRFNCNSVCEPTASVKEKVGTDSLSSNSNTPLPSSEHLEKIANITPAVKSNSSKVNLNIVLSHAINYRPTNGNESSNSDIDSGSESAEPSCKIKLSTRPLRTDLSTKTGASTASSAPVGLPLATNLTSTSNLTANPIVQQRRAQFRSSRNLTINTSTTAAGVPPPSQSPTPANITLQNDTGDLQSATNNSPGVLNTAPALIVQRRPPLVRAMSAPVRTRSLDENTKGALAFQKRKLRRRKPITRNASICEKSESPVGGSVKNDILFDLNAVGGKKQTLSRTRSTLAVDVITLVSLVSSDGSDSEKEDSAPETGRGNVERSRSTGMPSLRKTGKSVSFQENYPPNFQLATKEYSHMIRRGSIAPLAARLRSNRPPTAPPVSIFMNETNVSNTTMTTSGNENFESNGSGDSNANIVSTDTQSPKNTSAPTDDDKQNADEYIYPEYVRSLKERECWKLYRKMSIKGVTVTYETVLRGMLTPTEFRQIQKQREIEEAKARALEEEKDAALEPGPPTSAVDRLTQKLLKK